jgi:hypothetical protein
MKSPQIAGSQRKVIRGDKEGALLLSFSKISRCYQALTS